MLYNHLMRHWWGGSEAVQINNALVFIGTETGSTSSGNINIKFQKTTNGSSHYTTGDVYYSSNGRDWNLLDDNGVNFNTSSKIYFIGNLNYSTESLLDNSDYLGKFTASGDGVKFTIEGDITSLTHGYDSTNAIATNNFNNLKESEYPTRLRFGNCFAGLKSVVSAKNLKLKFNGVYKYYRTFHNCTNLKYGPLLTHNRIYQGCYMGMFRNCDSLLNIGSSDLSGGSNGMAKSCYAHMFENCSSLNDFLALPSTSLADSCYWHMFDGCISMGSAPELPATELVDGCYVGMFANCTNLKWVKMLGERVPETYTQEITVTPVSRAAPPSGSTPSTVTGSMLRMNSAYDAIFGGLSTETDGWLYGVKYAVQGASKPTGDNFIFVCTPNIGTDTCICTLYNDFYEKYKTEIGNQFGYYARNYPERTNILSYLVPSVRANTNGSVVGETGYAFQFGALNEEERFAWAKTLSIANQNPYPLWRGNDDTLVGYSWKVQTSTGMLVRDWTLGTSGADAPAD